MAPKSYDGTAISVTFDMARCIHARNCFLKLPQVFDPDQRPWVQPDAAAPDEVAAVIRTCPSGALTYTREDGPDEAPPIINRVRLQENGPLELTGDYSLDGGTAQIRMVMCRCGQSSHMPHCDGSHAKVGFEATGEPKPKVQNETEERGGPVVVDVATGGPARARGNMEIVAGSGRRIAKVSAAALCRCGHSSNKPFCDGSHRDVGFEG